MNKFITIVFLLLTFISGACWAEKEDIISQFIPHIITVESNWDSHAISHRDCVGLMQISKSALAEYNYCVYKGPLYGSTCYYDRPNGHVYGCVHKNWDGVKTKKYTEEDLLIPEINIEIGTWYLRRLKNKYLKDKLDEFDITSKVGWQKYGVCDFHPQEIRMALILAAYNGGPTRLKRLGYDISKMPRETRNYVKKVMKLYHEAKLD